MYLSFGGPVKAIGEEIESGVFARFDPETSDLVGLTVVNFSQKFGVEPKEVTIPLQR